MSDQNSTKTTAPAPTKSIPRIEDSVLDFNRFPKTLNKIVDFAETESEEINASKSSHNIEFVLPYTARYLSCIKNNLISFGAIVASTETTSSPDKKKGSSKNTYKPPAGFDVLSRWVGLNIEDVYVPTPAVDETAEKKPAAVRARIIINTTEEFKIAVITKILEDSGYMKHLADKGIESKMTTAKMLSIFNSICHYKLTSRSTIAKFYDIIIQNAKPEHLKAAEAISELNTYIENHEYKDRIASLINDIAHNTADKFITKNKDIDTLYKFMISCAVVMAALTVYSESSKLIAHGPDFADPEVIDTFNKYFEKLANSNVLSVDLPNIEIEEDSIMESDNE